MQKCQLDKKSFISQSNNDIHSNSVDFPRAGFLWRDTLRHQKWSAAMSDKIIPLSTDTTAADMAGEPKPLTPEGEVTIEGSGVNLKGYKLVDGVYEGGPDDKNPVTLDVYPRIPIPAKDGSESE